MKGIKKILLSFLVLVYLTHVYNRLIYTPPIYVTVPSSNAQTIDNDFNKNANSTFILHRRHLPLTKKIDISELYPHLDVSGRFNLNIAAYCIQLKSPNEFFKLFFLEQRCNKAPPISC